MIKKTQTVKSPNEFDYIKISLASPEMIRQWSFGEVLKPETLNYRTLKPEKGGLFCEAIFGPVKDYECNCGKYKRIRYNGIICDKCHVEVTERKVRRERMGHIELAVPVTHIWFVKSAPSRIGNLLNLGTQELNRVIHYESYIVLDGGESDLEKGALLTDEEYNDLQEKYNYSIKAEMGAPALKELLSDIDLDVRAAELRMILKNEKSVQRKNDILKKLKIIEDFRQSGNRPEHMILDAIPVLPPDLRPLVHLEGGRFATSDLNDLYRRVITRNNRLKQLLEIKAPDVILRNEKRMLQEAVDSLFDNSRRSRPIKGRGNRLYKSLADMLKGKQGRFRQNLLGKRIDYSGRSVIVVGPELKLSQCGLPKLMALELFKPHIIAELEKEGYSPSAKHARRLVETEKPEVWEILENIVKDHPILLNRNPTLHRLGIQAFLPVLVEGQAIKLHPLVCSAFNADFDGDQMAVHVPLSFESQIEAKELMLSTHNILLPANGRPITTPTNDIVFGCYYITMMKNVDDLEEESKKFKRFSTENEAVAALHQGILHVHDPIFLLKPSKTNKYQMLITTAGRVLFNKIVPKAIGFKNMQFDRKQLNSLVAECIRVVGRERTVDFLDDLKNMGFKYSTVSGLSISVKDLIVPEAKKKILDESLAEVEKIRQSHFNGEITDKERYHRVVDIWHKTTQSVADLMYQELSKDQKGYNSIYMMAHSGARGSIDQIKQLAGMRGLMSKPQRKVSGSKGFGSIIENPILSNFREGLSILEYFLSTHGARKGLADTALKTADAGYLTRRLVDVAQNIIVTIDDCDTIMGQEIKALKEGERVIEPISDRILGRVALDDIIDPFTGDVLVEAGNEIKEDEAKTIEDHGIESVRIRSVLTCEAERGICAKCYGRNLATQRLVEVGEAVGIIAAQSIGEPGTQLTLRTFHIGGAASLVEAESKVVAASDGIAKFENLITIKNRAGQVVCVNRNAELSLQHPVTKIEKAKFPIPYGAIIKIKDEQNIIEGELLFEWDPHTTPIISASNGKIQFEDLLENFSFKQEIDEQSGMKQKIIIDTIGAKKLHPTLNIVDKNGKTLQRYALPTQARLLVDDNTVVSQGDILAKLIRETTKLKDITGGLPRVIELFEARKPGDQAIISEIDGMVRFGTIIRGQKRIIVSNKIDDEIIEREYIIPYGRHLTVHEGDLVHAGDQLTEGAINPHDILKIKGIFAVQQFLVNEIQEVYRMQDVKINDKHLEIIVKQMLQKVETIDGGDTTYLESELVDRKRIFIENEKIMNAGGQPATFTPILQGITKASLTSESFISAASFQETSKILTEAAIAGKKDYLLGLKENVILGHIIPAGTGISKYRNISINIKQDVI